MKKNKLFLYEIVSRYLLIIMFSFITIFLNIEISYAGITLDGTMGQSGTLTGPSYTITDTMGTQVGGNLFHSFGTFNVYTGESATFTGASSISNIIARVTGGSSSYIDGAISSSISGANLYFLNPAGVMFGKNATLDIKGSFYVSTADYLKLSDGGKFSATTPSDTVLTTAAPSAFGFTSSNPTGVSIDGGFLEVSEGKGITIVAGSIDIKNGYLYAPGGRINLAAVASTGEASITSSGINTDAFSTLGDINISHTDSTRETKNGYTIGNLDVSSTTGGSGSIYIRGGKFTLDGGYVFADTYGDTNGGGIDINIAGDINIINGSAITSDTSGKGNAGDINIKADNLNLTSLGRISTTALNGSTGNGGNITIKATDTINISGYSTSSNSYSASSIYSATYGVGNAGSITIETNNLNLMDLGLIGSATLSGSTGNAGDITIKAKDTINISGYYDSGNGVGYSTIYSKTYGRGNAGNITIETNNLNLTDVGTISSSAESGSSGNSGDIAIKAADTINISGYYDSGSALYGSKIGSETYGSGDAGSITIETGNLNLSNVGTISSYAQEGSTGNGGDITIKAAESVNISGYYDSGSGLYNSRIASETFGSGDAGNITIETGNLNLSDVGAIYANAREGSTGNSGDITIKATETINISGYYDSGDGVYVSSIKSETYGSGDAGNITIETSNLNLSDVGTISSSAWAGSTGNGGDITIKATEAINIFGYYDSGDGVYYSGIINETHGSGDAGSITIETSNLNLTDAGAISSSAREGSTGNGGDITIRATDMISISGFYDSGDGVYVSSIKSETYGSGDAGNITIETSNLNLTDVGTISSSAREGSTGNGGDITIKATETISISGYYDSGSGFYSSKIISEAYGSGDAGNITIETGNLNLSDVGTISSSARSGSTGNGGDITIKATETINISGYYDLGSGLSSSKISSETFGNGDAGNITIETGNLNLFDVGTISSSAREGSTGNSGDITIKAADLVNISGYFAKGRSVYYSGIISETFGGGNAGNITIETGNLNLTDVGAIYATAREGSTGNGGDITIKATETISISGYYDSGSALYSSKIGSETLGSGDAGNITIETGNLNLTDVGAIYATAREGSTGNGGDITIKATDTINISGSYEFTSDIIVSSGIYSGSSGSGQGGSISITTSNLTITDGGTISATSTGTGNAGDIQITAGDSLYMSGGTVQTSSEKTTGGSITITGNDIQLLNGSSISSNVKSGKDKGGNITISAATLCVLDNSEISADADLGYGGNITIGAHAVFLWDSSALHASSSITGQEGAININSPLSDVTGSLLQLNPSYLQAEKLLPESCGARKEQRGSFVVRGNEYLSPQHSRFLF
ncbi:MAG: S-layer family protein [Nitrospirae bacterium YQR-1]